MSNKAPNNRHPKQLVQNIDRVEVRQQTLNATIKAQEPSSSCSTKSAVSSHSTPESKFQEKYFRQYITRAKYELITKLPDFDPGTDLPAILPQAAESSLKDFLRTLELFPAKRQKINPLLEHEMLLENQDKTTEMRVDVCDNEEEIDNMPKLETYNQSQTMPSKSLQVSHNKSSLNVDPYFENAIMPKKEPMDNTEINSTVTVPLNTKQLSSPPRNVFTFVESTRRSGQELESYVTSPNSMTMNCSSVENLEKAEMQNIAKNKTLTVENFNMKILLSSPTDVHSQKLIEKRRQNINSSHVDDVSSKDNAQVFKSSGKELSSSNELLPEQTNVCPDLADVITSSQTKGTVLHSILVHLKNLRDAEEEIDTLSTLKNPMRPIKVEKESCDNLAVSCASALKEITSSGSLPNDTSTLPIIQRDCQFMSDIIKTEPTSLSATPSKQPAQNSFSPVKDEDRSSVFYIIHNSTTSDGRSSPIRVTDTDTNHIDKETCPRDVDVIKSKDASSVQSADDETEGDCIENDVPTALDYEDASSDPQVETETDDQYEAPIEPNACVAIIETEPIGAYELSHQDLSQDDSDGDSILPEYPAEATGNADKCEEQRQSSISDVPGLPNNSFPQKTEFRNVFSDFNLCSAQPESMSDVSEDQTDLSPHVADVGICSEKQDEASTGEAQLSVKQDKDETLTSLTHDKVIRGIFETLISEIERLDALNLNIPFFNSNLNIENAITLTNRHQQHFCPVCNRPFKYLSHVQQHVKTHFDSKPYKCHLCPKTFSREHGGLRKHLQTHLSDKSLTCKICEKTFSQKSYLVQHQSCHADEKPFECDLCDKSFKKKCHLQSHKACQHSDAKPFICETCGKCYKLASHLAAHIKTHGSVRNFACSQCCKSFFTQDKLNRHNRTHSEEKTYKCEFCGKEFRERFNYHRHLERVCRPSDQSRKFKCDYCEKRFVQKSHCKVHMRIHTAEIPYWCQLCGKGFKTAGNRKSHYTWHVKKKDIESLEVALEGADVLVEVQNSFANFAEGKMPDAGSVKVLSNDGDEPIQSDDENMNLGNVENAREDIENMELKVEDHDLCEPVRT